MMSKTKKSGLKLKYIYSRIVFLLSSFTSVGLFLCLKPADQGQQQKPLISLSPPPSSLAPPDSALRFNFIVGIGSRMGQGAVGHVN